MANANENASWAGLKIVLSALRFATICPVSDDASTATTLTQFGAIAALANTGINDTDPVEPTPVR